MRENTAQPRSGATDREDQADDALAMLPAPGVLSFPDGRSGPARRFQGFGGRVRPGLDSAWDLGEVAEQGLLWPSTQFFSEWGAM